MRVYAFGDRSIATFATTALSSQMAVHPTPTLTQMSHIKTCRPCTQRMRFPVRAITCGTPPHVLMACASQSSAHELAPYGAPAKHSVAPCLTQLVLVLEPMASVPSAQPAPHLGPLTMPPTSSAHAITLRCKNYISTATTLPCAKSSGPYNAPLQVAATSPSWTQPARPTCPLASTTRASRNGYFPAALTPTVSSFALTSSSFKDSHMKNSIPWIPRTLPS